MKTLGNLIALAATLLLAISSLAADKTQVESFRKAAEQGSLFDQTMLASCYEYGNGVITNATEAVKWYRKAAEQGYKEAQVLLGFCYQNGGGVAKDEIEAVKWFRKAAEHGDESGQYMLGLYYQHGKGVPKDGSSEFSADEFSGQFITRDLIAAITADHIQIPEAPSEIESLNNLLSGSSLHSKFPRIPLPKAAEDLIKRESMLSSKERIKLNRLILEAAYLLKCPKKAKDYVEAYKWFNLAADQSYELAKKTRSEVGQRMTKEQIAEAQRLAREFKPQKAP